MGDEQKIREVLVNLIDNAIKYTREGGKVEISHQLDKNFLTTSIKDNGIGMDQKSQNSFLRSFSG